MPLHAFDRSMRSLDRDGRLHVERAPISKANVCPYFGREIPKWQELGLDPARIYRLYRDPAELAAAVSTFRNIPLLIKHVPISAAKPAKELWVGTIGSDVEFNAPYLSASIAAWDGEAIKLIETSVQEELSSCYYYTADMTPGATPDGDLYDGVMRNIIGNHVAIVEEGRAGPDVAVPDELPSELRAMKLPKLTAFLARYLPHGADLPALDAQLAALDAKDMDDKADDSDLDDEEKKKACDAWRSARDKANDASMTDEEKAEAYKEAKDQKAKDKAAKDKAAKDKKAKDAGNANAPDSPEGGAKKPAQDSITRAEAERMANDAAAGAETRAVHRVEALYRARKMVEPICGVVAMDSADAVYAFALKQAGVEISGVHASAYPALLDMALKQRRAAPPPQLALDSSHREAMDKAFPGLKRFKQG